jgi:hypothetical protein
MASRSWSATALGVHTVPWVSWEGSPYPRAAAAVRAAGSGEPAASAASVSASAAPLATSKDRSAPRPIMTGCAVRAPERM